MGNYGKYAAMEEALRLVKSFLDQKYKKKTIRAYLKKKKDQQGITMLNFKKQWKQKYGTEFQLRERKKESGLQQQSLEK